MRKAYLVVYHKEEDARKNIVHRKVFEGFCKVTERFSVREQQGSVENNSTICVRLMGGKNYKISCGDRCFLDGEKRTVHKVSKCIKGASAPFRHTALYLR